MSRGNEKLNPGVRDDMDGHAEDPEQRNPEAATEDHIEAEAPAEMHHLRNMLDQVGRRDFLEGLFTLLKALNSLIGYMKAMNRHVGKIDEEISNNTKLLESLDEKVTSLLQKNTVGTPKATPMATPMVFQGSCSQHTSDVLNHNETPTATFHPKESTPKVVAKEALDEVKKKLDMCVDLTLSDDDDVNLNTSPTKVPDVGMGDARGVSVKPSKTTKKRTSTRDKDMLKGLEIDFDVSDDCKVVQSPSPPLRNNSGSKGSPSEDKTKEKGKKVAGTPTSRPRKIARSLISPDKNKAVKKIGLTLPKGMDSKFHPTSNMALTIDDLRLCAYVFQLNGDPREELFKVGSTIGTREEFQTLCPDHVINKKIIEFMALLLYWNQNNTDTQRAWILPPRFVEAVLKGKMSEDLLPEFSRGWMPAFDSLSYIYVPVMEPNGHWFLMVVSMDETVVYLVDSNRNSLQTAARKKTIRRIGKVIGRMMFSSYYLHNYKEGNIEVGTWDIEEATSCEDHTTSTQQSTICTLEWMHMDDVFMSNLLPRVEDKLVRMKAAMKLLNGPHNEHLGMIVEKAKRFWENHMYSD